MPHYEELSVKNLYDDAMHDELVKDYLPDLKQNSNRTPERNIFFGVVGTLRPLYLKKLLKMLTKSGMKQILMHPQKNSFC